MCYKKAMADLYYARNLLKKQWLKNKFWFLPVSCRYQSSKCTGRSSDSSRLLRLPSILPVAKNATNINFPNESRDTQQQELFRIHTGFPFHSSASKRGIWAPCAPQMYLLIFNLPNNTEDFFCVPNTYIYDINFLRIEHYILRTKCIISPDILYN